MSHLASAWLFELSHKLEIEGCGFIISYSIENRGVGRVLKVGRL